MYSISDSIKRNNKQSLNSYKFIFSRIYFCYITLYAYNMHKRYLCVQMSSVITSKTNNCFNIKLTQKQFMNLPTNICKAPKKLPSLGNITIKLQLTTPKHTDYR